MELTVPMESQIDNWHSTKTNKYTRLCKQLEESGYQVEFFAVEVGCRGLIPKSVITYLRRIGLGKKHIREFSSSLSHLAIKSSMQIFQNRSSKLWEVGNI